MALSGAPAQAEGLGQRDSNRYLSIEGAEQSFSIAHVPLVVGDSVRVQQYPALSGLGAKLGNNLNPGRWPGLCYFAPLGLKPPKTYQPLGPEGAKESFSFPNVTLVVGNSVRV